MTPLALEAPAKLNLSLSVVDRRPDGLHELAGVMVLLELADRLLLMPGCSGLRIEGLRQGGVPVHPDENLAWRGLVAGLDGEPDLACLTVEKRIPAASGLGGGSSDAAAAWRLGRRWRGADEPPAADAVAALAAVGADVPFFAAGAPAAFVTGIGERVEPLEPGPPVDVVLVHPPFELATAAVFGELHRAEWTVEPPQPAVGRPGRNDLLAPARRLRPQLEEVWRAVLSAGGEPHLTGSGPTVFCLPGDPERGAAIAARLGELGLETSQTRTRTTPTIIEELTEEEP